MKLKVTIRWWKIFREQFLRRSQKTRRVLPIVKEANRMTNLINFTVQLTMMTSRLGPEMPLNWNQRGQTKMHSSLFPRMKMFFKWFSLFKQPLICWKDTFPPFVVEILRFPKKNKPRFLTFSIESTNFWLVIHVTLLVMTPTFSQVVSQKMKMICNLRDKIIWKFVKS